MVNLKKILLADKSIETGNETVLTFDVSKKLIRGIIVSLMSTQDKHSSSYTEYSRGYKLTEIQQLPNKSTRLLTNSLTHQLRILNCCFYFTIPPKFSLRSSENIGHEVGKKPLILAFHVSCSVYF